MDKTKIQLHFLLILYCCMLHVLTQELIISPEGSNHVVAIDDSIIFVCEVINAQNQDAKLKWFDPYDEEILETSGRVFIERPDEVTIKLLFMGVAEQDTGRYTCKGEVLGTASQLAFTLDIYKDITFDYAPTPQNPIEFEDSMINCQVSGNPSPEVTWRYRGSVISTGGRYVIDPSYGLLIKNISEEDNGRYECRAEVRSTGAVDKVDIDVIVHRKPRITKELGITTGVEHQQVAIECKAEGLPDPYYEFYRVNEGGELSRLSSTETRFVDEIAGVVHYNPLTRDDQAEYLCKALNDAGEVDSYGYLDVIIPPKIYQYLNMTQKEKNPVTLTCLSEGEPSPNMTFRKVGNSYDYVNGENDGGRVLVRNPESGRLELTIDSLVPEDTCNYTCKSHNKGGFAEQNGTIIVEFEPRFPEQETVFYGWPGKTRNLTCHTLSEPAPSFQWWHNNRELENNETFRIIPLIKDCVLQIYMREEDKLWIYRDYTCRAKNQHGENDLLMYFYEATKPDAPKGAEVIDESPTMVVLDVFPPDNDGGMPIIGFRVDFESTHADFNIGEEIRIENLRPTSTYIFNVRARNEVDVSDPFRLSHTMQDISEPHQIIIISDPEGLYPYDYTLLWEKPLTGGIPIKEYRFRYRRVKVADDGSYDIIEIIDDQWVVRYKEDDPDWPMSSYKLEGLKPDTYYQVEIEARNDIGWSTPSDEFVFHTYREISGPIRGTGTSVTVNTAILLTALCIYVHII